MNLPDRPTLLLDEARCRHNISSMVQRAHHTGVAFRPHFKTHQSRYIGRMFRDEGVAAITVSSLAMAEYFAADGWDDITIAFPFNLRECSRLRGIPAHVALHLLVEDVSVVRSLDTHLPRNVGVFIKIDTGSGRTGVPWDDADAIGAVVDAVSTSTQLRFSGFLTHAGNTYGAASRDEILSRHHRANDRMRTLRTLCGDRILSVGDTPGCSLAESYEGIDEIRPGNFVFYDVMQLRLGVCEPHQVATALCAPVTAVHASRGELVIYGGAAHLSRDRSSPGDGPDCYGLVAEMHEHGWGEPVPGAYVHAISQEHGIVRAPESFILQHPPGSVVAVLPVHSCLTSQAMGGYQSTDGREIDHLAGRWL